MKDTVLLETLTVAQLVEEFLSFYENRSYIIVFKTSRNWNL